MEGDTIIPDQPVTTTAPVVEVAKPVFRMETFGAPVIAPTTVPATPVVVEPVESGVPVGEAAANATIPAATTENTAPVAETVKEENTASFDMAALEGDTPIPAGATPVVAVNGWKEALKGANREEALKELGLDDFDIKFSDYRKSGKDPYAYLQAKAYDWNKVPDEEVVMGDLKKEFPDATTAQLGRLFNKKYSQTDLSEDEDKEDGILLMRNDARKIRVNKIAEQQSFEIPNGANHQADNSPAEIEKVLQQQVEVAQSNHRSLVESYEKNPLTQSLMDSKRVAVDLGEEKKFFFEVNKPELITRAITDGAFWKRLTSVNPQEADPTKLVSDVAKQQRIALIAMNPNYEKDIFNHGVAQGMKKVVEEGQNAKRPIGTVPSIPHDTPLDAARRARSSTFGA